ncbi:hypothetical protein DPEC_G00096450 [Dallia pectoralis]|uniref:Uncharacterized protein n=1 Tax=Dallia pectoralis TaxID=75939 RepID=A0ACC2GWG9_DALPE|nr:hypothetical protein DPEC_G00096450 [Dallia pectoralis]
MGECEAGSVYKSADILRAAGDFYGRLYNTKPSNEDLTTAFLQGFGEKKAPGPDGVPEEFYQTFWDFIKENVAEVFQAIYRERSYRFRPNMQHPREVYKQQPAPGERCHPTQERRSPLGLLSLDQEKAFDKVSHGFLQRVLKKMNFPQHLINWTNLCYQNIYTRVLVNNILTDPFTIRSGVRHGCPLAPLLYVIYLEPFLERIRTSPGIPGYQLPEARGERLRVVAYTDDITIVGTDSRSITTATKAVDDYCTSHRSPRQPGQGIPPGQDKSKKIECLMFTFVWGSQMERLQRSILYKTAGNGVPDILNIIRAQQLSNLVKTFNKPDRKASFFERHYATPILRTLGMGTIDHTVPYSWDPPKVYRTIRDFAFRSGLSAPGLASWKYKDIMGHIRSKDTVAPESQLSGGPATGNILNGPPGGWTTTELRQQWRIIRVVKQVLWETRSFTKPQWTQQP